MEETIDRVVFLNGFINNGGGRGDSIVSSHPLFKYASSNHVVHRFVCILISVFDGSLAVARVDEKNESLISGVPAVVGPDLKEVKRAVAFSHSKRLSKHLEEAVAMEEDENPSGVVSLSLNPKLEKYPGRFWY